MDPMAKEDHMLRMMVTVTVDAFIFVKTYGDAIHFFRREKAAKFVLQKCTMLLQIRS